MFEVLPTAGLTKEISKSSVSIRKLTVRQGT